MFKSNTNLTNNFQMVAKSEAIRKDTNGYQAEENWVSALLYEYYKL